MSLPLFPGVPGGPELLVLLIIVVLLFGVPLVLIAGGVIAWRSTQSGDEDRVEALESRVAELEQELEDARGEDPGDGDGSGPGGGDDPAGDPTGGNGS